MAYAESLRSAYKVTKTILPSSKLQVLLSNVRKGPVYETLSGLEEVLQRQYQVASQCLEMAPHSLYYIHTMQYVYCVMLGLSMAYKKINPNSCSVKQNEIKSFRDVLASLHQLLVRCKERSNRRGSGSRFLPR